MGLAMTMTVFTRKSVIDMQRRFQDVAYVSVYMQWFRIITFKISSKKVYWFPQIVPEDTSISVCEWGFVLQPGLEESMVLQVTNSKLPSQLREVTC